MVARSTDNLDTSGEPATRSVGTTANLKGKMNKRLSVVKGHFPKLVDCAHFHYENVEFGSIELQFANEQNDACWNSLSAKDLVFLVHVSCQGKMWMVRRSYEEFCTLDAHLHQCIYDRRYSQLLPLPPLSEIGDRVEIFTPLLSEYLSRLSMIVDNKLNCGPVLTWMEIDNRGNRFLLKEEASLNVPAIAAAHVIKRYTAQASDEISIEVGDILSVIDMPPKEDTSWWRGKHGFQVGFFPSECVELINEKLSQPACKTDGDPANSNTSAPGPPSPTSVSKKHGKLMGFLRTFMKSRPTKQKLKQRGILKERVFGCDLGEHLLNSGLDVPQVLKSCSEFIEKHGVVDGIYRHSGVSSNIQKLRHEFDSENIPDLTKDMYMQDIHCVGSLCKLYFRELPNPLLTYQLYDKFADCMGEMTDDERMVKVHDVIQQLPPPHYRTLEYLIRHLARLATCSGETNMHIKNLAIVWAPNLLRSMEIESMGLTGADPFKEVRIQSVVVEFLLSHVDVLFSDSFTSVGRFTGTGRHSLTRPKSFVSTRLLSLEEAQARTQAPLLLQEASLQFQGKFHTVLDLPVDRRKRGMKVRKAAGGSWKTFFAIGKTPGAGRRKPMRISSLFQPTTSHADLPVYLSLAVCIPLSSFSLAFVSPAGCRVDSVTLRSAKSEESLSSQHSGAGQSKHLRRPRSSSDGLSLAASMDPLRPPSRLPSSRSYDSLLPEDRHPQPGNDDEDDDDEEGVYMLPDFSNQDQAASWMAEDVIDFSPTFLEDGPIGLGGCAVAAGGRESPPTGTPPPYRCLSHHGHAHSSSQRSITEDPDSVLNQSDAAVRRSLIIAATAPPLQVFCQHRLANTGSSAGHSGEGANQSPSSGQSQGQPTTPVAAASSSQPPLEKRSFTRKMVNAFSQKAPKSPPLDISDPVSISVPAKVLDMIGGRAGELQQAVAGTPSSVPSQSQPPQMISMLLRSCDFQLTESCQQEIRSKLGPEAKTRGLGLSGSALPSQAPPPPPKNPARLMALALAESAHKALRQGASPPYRPPQSRPQDTAETRCQRSLSADAGELLSSDPNQLYSTVRPLSVWMTEGKTTETALDTGHGQGETVPGQDTGSISSETSVSDTVLSNSEQSAGNSSGDELTPSPIYKNQKQLPHTEAQPPKPDLPGERPHPSDTERKPPAYSRQFSAPHLQQKSSVTSTQSKPSFVHPNSHLQHSKSESSPLAQVRALQPTRPKVPPKPLDLERPHRAPLAKTEMRRSLDSGRIRRIFGQQGPQGNPPLARAFSERLSGAPDHLVRYHAAKAASQPVPGQQPHQAQIRPVPLSSTSEDQGKSENFYYEIAGPENPQGPPSYARHSYQNMRLDLDGNLRQASNPEANQRPISRGHHQHQPQPIHHNQSGSKGERGPQLWSSEATRAWAAAHSQSHSICHSHHYSQDNSPHHHLPSHLRSQRQSSSVRLARSEMHPLSSSSMVPLALHQHQRSLHRSNRSPSNDHTASLLHPYFENGKVCYRKPEEGPPSQSQPLQGQPPQRSPPQALRQNSSEPIYVNFPFTSPSTAANSTKSWTTTDLDGDPPRGESVAPLTNPPPPEDQTPCSPCLAPEPGGSTCIGLSPSTPDSPAACEKPSATTPGSDLESDCLPVPSASTSAGAHFHSRSDPYSCSTKPIQGLSGKEIASLLIEKLDEEEKGEGPSTVTSSASTNSSPTMEHPPNPYPSQHHNQPPPAYNVYTPGPSRSRASQSVGSSGYQRQDLLRRSTSGGQYRQAFDVMPSGDQVLKYYRTQDFPPGPAGERQSAGANPYPPREHYQEAIYHNRSPQEPHSSDYPSQPLSDPSTSPPAAFSTLMLGDPRPYPSQPGGVQYNQHPFPHGLALGQYPNPPPRRDMIHEPVLRPPALRNQRGLARQGSLPGPSPNWTIHTEGQTRSYC
ncbi:rho GTPase-activating protein 33 isoform X2 [Esox lucius]|uniref:rho GTPase-activating protein 33 isoform X2 n=1 Tax=Esox lucius TaxID=8010 RepID=UPI001477698C|nr:rho GTPase-activating protein 33 isoform X2 [Esox lucius]